ncbi:hypothetical protein Kpho02_57770 [Kitasatospora phosalacinea]|uniref:Uncharacterized protein n=1 Tax=Kitasatospora phosalacinea TaxID=2065 RepID=A0A9W6QEM5_9ACTN|nr:hypothetical protein [Kitasatospora phosalacinea]GLW73478.1 hypothetical protein Kpho02_57770 [Kitasatospora phosalacinea]
MSGTRTPGGRLGRVARHLGYRTRTVSWTALCTLCALLGPATATITITDD